MFRASVHKSFHHEAHEGHEGHEDFMALLKIMFVIATRLLGVLSGRGIASAKNASQ
jgi:hypothetical protein